MNGPTGMGIAKLVHDNGGIEGNDKYQFVKYDDTSLATADLVAGKIDLACLPTNTAASLYNKTGKVTTLAINCLNSLYIMTKTGVEINDLADLEGKTIYTPDGMKKHRILQLKDQEAIQKAAARIDQCATWVYQR
jgi:NitT/TauT family transport system substrate-binding protein